MVEAVALPVSCPKVIAIEQFTTRFKAQLQGVMPQNYKNVANL